MRADHPGFGMVGAERHQYPPRVLLLCGLLRVVVHFPPTLRILFSTTASVRPPERPGHRGGAHLYPAALRPYEAILAALCERTVADAARRAPVLPLRAGDAPRSSPRAEWSQPSPGGPARRRARPGPLPSRTGALPYP